MVSSQRIAVSAVVLPPIAIGLTLFLFAHAPSEHPALLTFALIASPPAVFIELAAVIFLTSQWRAGKLSGAAVMACALLGCSIMFAAACFVVLLFGGAGGV